jgi:hypothetical protein
VDAYGREIFVESREGNGGRPLVWFQISDKGRVMRFERNLLGIRGRPVNKGEFDLDRLPPRGG